MKGKIIKQKGRIILEKGRNVSKEILLPKRFLQGISAENHLILLNMNDFCQTLLRIPMKFLGGGAVSKCVCSRHALKGLNNIAQGLAPVERR